MDLNRAPNHDVPGWSETRWNGCWCPDEGAGLYLHMGRKRGDLDLWWAQTVAYLPDGRLAVDRSWSRASDERTVRTGNLELRAEESGWSSSFDGVGELVTVEQLASAPRGSSAPSVAMSWEVSAEPASPAWDMYEDVSDEQQFAGDSHVQQGFTTSGTLTVAGETYRLDGVGFKDHSSGVRDWTGFGHHHFALAVMPEWTLHGISIFGADGTPRPPMGALFRGSERHGIARSEMAPMEDACGGPYEHDYTVELTSGEEITMRAEVLTTLPILITEVNDNINGIDWELDGDPLVLQEAIARLTLADGTVGYAFHERSIRRNRLERPAPRALAGTQEAG